MSSVQSTIRLSISLSDEEKRRRLHRVYLYILSLRPKKSDDQDGPSDRPSTEVASDIQSSQGAGAGIDLPDEPERQLDDGP
jgi:hypothetical protein